jgi:hypothetical protein
MLSAMLGDERVGGGAVFAQRLRRARLVFAHQPAVARNDIKQVGRELGVRWRLAAPAR